MSVFTSCSVSMSVFTACYVTMSCQLMFCDDVCVHCMFCNDMSFHCMFCAMFWVHCMVYDDDCVHWKWLFTACSVTMSVYLQHVLWRCLWWLFTAWSVTMFVFIVYSVTMPVFIAWCLCSLNALWHVCVHINSSAMLCTAVPTPYSLSSWLRVSVIGKPVIHSFISSFIHSFHSHSICCYNTVL